MKLYGIANCDTVRKARKFLEAEGVEFEFVNTKKIPPTPEEIADWIEKDGFDVVINTKSRIWKGLEESTKLEIENGDYKAISENPSVLKRPVLETGDKKYFGYKEIEYWVTNC